mgnify:CR=1 FL=1
MANKFLRDDFDIAKRFGYHGVPTFDWNDYVLTEGDDDKSIIFGFELELGCTQEVTTEMYKELVKMFPVIFESDSSIMGNRTSSIIYMVLKWLHNLWVKTGFMHT